MNRLCPICEADFSQGAEPVEVFGPPGPIGRTWFDSRSCKIQFIQKHIDRDCPECGERLTGIVECRCGFNLDTDHADEPPFDPDELNVDDTTITNAEIEEYERD